MAPEPLMQPQSGAMAHTLRYRTTRLGAWRFYWRTWRSRLWSVHAVTSVVIGLAMLGFMPGLRSVAGFATATLVTLAAVTAISLSIPQLRFRRVERTLTVDESGWSTQVGARSGARSWRETMPIFEQSGAVVIASRNHTALVIPDNAFASAAQRHQFIQDIRAWQSRGRPSGSQTPMAHEKGP